jgi:hypothetical protein
MPRSRPTSNPISYHKHTKQYYVTRSGRRIYLGSDKEQALEKYHRLGFVLVQRELDNFTLRLRECLAFGKEVFLGIGEFWITIARECSGGPI